MVPHATKVKSPCHTMPHGDSACAHTCGTLTVLRRSVQQSTPRRARGRPCSLPGAPPERAKLVIAALRAPAGSSAAEGTRSLTMRVAFRKSVDSRCTWARRPARRPSSAQGPPGVARPYARRGQAPAARRTATAPSLHAHAWRLLKKNDDIFRVPHFWVAGTRTRARLQLAALGGDGAACPGCQCGALPARIRRVRTCTGQWDSSFAGPQAPVTTGCMPRGCRRAPRLAARQGLRGARRLRPSGRLHNLTLAAG